MAYNLKFNNKFNSIIVGGDIHGDIHPLVFKITQQYKIKDSLIIVAGDIGLGFHKSNHNLRLLEEADRKLKASNNIVLLLRGNHDNPAIWFDKEFEQYEQDGFRNIRLLKDYTVIECEDSYYPHKILCVGGAISIDRIWRKKKGIGFWEDEPFVYKEEEIKDLEGITHVITHSSPDFCEPIIKTNLKEWFEEDSELEADCKKEREDHTKLYNKLSEKNNIIKWCNGHFHFSWIGEFNKTTFKLCAIMELYEV